MDKMKLAHDYFMKHGRNNSWMESDVADAWKYADAMQAEWGERDSKEACCHDWNETTSNGDKYRFFVCKHCDATRNFEPIDEWQPDWSKAPSWANEWHYWPDETATWYDHYTNHCKSCEAPSFNYQGDWEDSLRKRP